MSLFSDRFVVLSFPDGHYSASPENQVAGMLRDFPGSEVVRAGLGESTAERVAERMERIQERRDSGE